LAGREAEIGMAAETLMQQDVVELSKQGYFTMLLDENLLALETGLRMTALR